MAYYRRRKGGWRVEVERRGDRRSASFPTKAMAEHWAAAQEAEILAGTLARWPRKTLRQAMDRYREEVSPAKAGKNAERNEGLRFDALARDFPELVGKVLHTIDTPDIAAWRDARLKVVTPGTVERDINLLSNVFTIARNEWRWCGESPFRGLRRPGDNPPRTRLLERREIKLMLRGLGYRTGEPPKTKMQEVAYAWLIALRTGMRAGEVLALSDKNVDLGRRVAEVPHKMQRLTGRLREVPMQRQVAPLMRPLLGRGRLVHISPSSLDALFRKVRDQLGLEGFTFHDSRAHALTRLARKVDVLTLARISGHKDLKLLMRVYYRESSAAIAARL